LGLVNIENRKQKKKVTSLAEKIHGDKGRKLKNKQKTK